jgi:tetratricopeptide (TPR) repeat protein
MIHSTFSPAGMSAKLLEQTLVQREGLAQRLTQLFVESALTDSKHHVLLVGPRGIGKSHLASLVYHRLLNNPELKDRLVIAYLREDEWGVTSFLDLLVRILRELNVPTHELQSLSTEGVEVGAWRTLHDLVQGKTLLVILENLDTILRSLGEEGQRKWRSCIQNSPLWSVLATTPSLSEDISDHASPFYGFFEIQPLEGLSVSDAVTLLQHLAECQGRREIAEYVTSPAGRARVRAVQHLANGNHRIFVIFYEFLAHDKEADLVEPVLKTIDFLTPYYQSQMKELSPQQRKLVEFLCRFRSAANVKTIASACFVSHQTAASQLKQLLESRYLRVTRIGRESYYELKEPLLRICVEAKSHSGEPVKMLVEFLRYWFARQELEQKLTAMEEDVPERAYFVAALREYENDEGHTHLSPDVSRLCQALSCAMFSGNKALITSTALELAQVSKIAEDWIHYTKGVSYSGDSKGAMETLQGAVREHPDNAEALLGLARACSWTGRGEEALRLIERVITLEPNRALVWVDKGKVLEKLQKDGEALDTYSHASDLRPRWDVPAREHARLLFRMGKHAEVRRVLRPFVRRRGCDPRILVTYGSSLRREGKFRTALAYFTKVTKAFPQRRDACLLQGKVLLDLKRPREALTALEKALQIAPEDRQVQYGYCEALFAVGQYQRSLAELAVEVVAHCIFHVFLGLANRGHNKEEIESTLLRFHSIFGKSPGPDALAGGLIEFTSHMYRHAEADEAPLLRRWFEAISRLFSADPHFQILIKVFDVIVRYKESQDEKVLLELPLEQRRLLESPEPGPEKTPASEPATPSQRSADLRL